MTERLLLHVSTTFQKHSTGSGTRVSWPNFIISAFVDKLMPGLNATCQTDANPSALTTPRPPGSLCQLGYHRVLSLVPFYSSHTLLIYRNVSRIQRNVTNLLTIQLWQPSVTIDSVACEQQLQVSVNATSRWLSDWRLTVNTDKTVVMEFTRRPIPSDLAINLNGTQLRKVKEQRHLGLILSFDLRWTEHTNRVLSKAARLLHTLRRLRNSLSRQALLFYYCLYICPVIEYASVALLKLPAHLRDRLEQFQRRALKIIIRKPIFQHCDHNDLLLTLNQASLQSRRHFQSALVGFHLANETAPPHLQEVCYPRASVDHSLRHHNFFQLPKANSTLFQSSPLYFASHSIIHTIIWI